MVPPLPWVVHVCFNGLMCSGASPGLLSYRPRILQKTVQLAGGRAARMLLAHAQLHICLCGRRAGGRRWREGRPGRGFRTYGRRWRRRRVGRGGRSSRRHAAASPGAPASGTAVKLGCLLQPLRPRAGLMQALRSTAASTCLRLLAWRQRCSHRLRQMPPLAAAARLHPAARAPRPSWAARRAAGAGRAAGAAAPGRQRRHGRAPGARAVLRHLPAARD